MERAEEKTGKLRKISNYLLAAVILLCLIFAVYVTVCTARGKPVDLFGYSILRVETGSMEPTLHVGDCIIVRKTAAEALTEGDIISYYSEQADIRGMLVTHRIVQVLPDGTFLTRGDANSIEDSVPVRGEQIMGRYTRKAGFYKWLGSFADSRKLILLGVMLPMCGLALYELRSLMKIGGEISAEQAEEAEQAAKEEYERRMREAIEEEKKRLAAAHYQPEDEVKKE